MPQPMKHTDPASFSAFVERHGGVPKVKRGNDFEVDHAKMASLWGAWRAGREQ